MRNPPVLGSLDDGHGLEPQLAVAVEALQDSNAFRGLYLTVEADRLGRLVRSLLRLTRLDQGDPIQPVACDVERLIGAEIERVRLLAPDLDVRLHGPRSPANDLLLDAAAVAEIVSNLLDNALRHATDRVDVTLEESASQLRISVGDDGPGLPAGGEERAFDRFVSLDGQGGSGLGLSIARSWLRPTVASSSTPPVGSCSPCRRFRAPERVGRWRPFHAVIATHEQRLDGVVPKIA